MAGQIVVIGSLDTKADDFAFVKQELQKRGHNPTIVDVGVLGAPGFAPDVAAEEVAQAGGADLATLREAGDRGAALDAMAKGIVPIVQRLRDEGRLDGVLSMGGSGATGVATAAMRALPLGVPKVMVSTIASGDTSQYVGIRDIVMIPAITDVAGVNRISARVYANAVGAVVGMVETPEPAVEKTPLVALSMFGNTTQAADFARRALEAAGYEVLIFHAVGTGGRTMESLIAEGYIDGALDMTTTEWADELIGGVLAAGPERLDAAAKAGIPQVVAPGCLDMVNFWAPETIPDRFQGRQLHHWSPGVTLMRTTVAENAELGRILAEKVNRSSAPVAIFLPLKGVSMLDSPGQPFWSPEADHALFDAIRQGVKSEIEVHEIDANINDESFAVAMAGKLLEFLSETKGSRTS